MELQERSEVYMGTRRSIQEEISTPLRQKTAQSSWLCDRDLEGQGSVNRGRDYTPSFLDTIMSDSEHSTVTYTSVSEDDLYMGSPGVEVPIYEGPPSPDYVPGPEEPEQAPPSPIYKYKCYCLL
ncbi:hypothetical protein Tco_0311811 [Tanacetum coccineum]